MLKIIPNELLRVEVNGKVVQATFHSIARMWHCQVWVNGKLDHDSTRTEAEMEEWFWKQVSPSTWILDYHFPPYPEYLGY